MSKERNTNALVLETLTKSKVLNAGVTLEQIIVASREITQIVGDHNLAAWTFISPSYIYTGSDVVGKDIATKVTTKK